MSDVTIVLFPTPSEKLNAKCAVLRMANGAPTISYEEYSDIPPHVRLSDRVCCRKRDGSRGTFRLPDIALRDAYAYVDRENRRIRDVLGLSLQ